MEQMFMEMCSSQDNVPSHNQQRIISIETSNQKQKRKETKKEEKGQNLFTSPELQRLVSQRPTSRIQGAIRNAVDHNNSIQLES